MGSTWDELSPADRESTLKELFGGDWRLIGGVMPEGSELAARYYPAASGRSVLSGLLILGPSLTADHLRAIPVSAIENSYNLGVAGAEEAVAQLPPLQRSKDTDPEAFSQLVAEHFKTWGRFVRYPAAAMAAETGVKLPTVHTWIREARLRGFLPPARRGKELGVEGGDDADDQEG